MKTRTLLMIVGAVLMASGLANPTSAAPVSWSTNMANAGSYNWGNSIFWDAGVPLDGDDAFMTNAITASRIITNGALSINLANFTMNWNSANTGTFNLSGAANTTNYFVVTGTTIIGSNAVFALNPSSTDGGAFMTNNNLYLISNGQIRLGIDARGQTVVVTGSFSNSPTSLFQSVHRNDGRLVFTTDQPVTNRGNFVFSSTATGASSLPQVSIAGTNKLVNTGTVQAIYVSTASTQVNPALTLISEFDNFGTVIVTNMNNNRLTLRVVGRSGSSVTNAGTWIMVGVTNRAQTTITLGGFVNRGRLTLESANPVSAAVTNLFTLSEVGATFRNDVGGQLAVLGGANALRADRIINDGTNSIASSGTLFYQTRTGAANVFENAGELRVDGTVVATAITNQSGGVIQGNGKIVANIFSLSGSYIAPGNSIGTNSVTGNVTIGDGATLRIELGSSAGENDLLAITGGLTLGATSILDLSGGALSLVYTVATFNAGSLVGTFGTVTPGYLVTYGDDYISVIIPEPSTWVLVGAGVLGMVLLGHWRRRS